MKQIILTLLITSFLSGCGSSDDQSTSQAIDHPTENSVLETFAVIWRWTTTDVGLVSEKSPVLAQELTALWEAGTVENTYYDANSSVDKLAHFPNISFFLRARDQSDAKAILDDMTIVKEGIASYLLHPVGLLWLGRIEPLTERKASLTSFVAVWTTNRALQASDTLMKQQTEKIIDLWKEGVIENVYFDAGGIQELNRKTDFVFFVNAGTERKANEICQSLPLVMGNFASYKLYQAGSFWMGKSEN